MLVFVQPGAPFTWFNFYYELQIYRFKEILSRTDSLTGWLGCYLSTNWWMNVSLCSSLRTVLNLCDRLKHVCIEVVPPHLINLFCALLLLSNWLNTIWCLLPPSGCTVPSPSVLLPLMSSLFCLIIFSHVYFGVLWSSFILTFTCLLLFVYQTISLTHSVPSVFCFLFIPLSSVVFYQHFLFALRSQMTSLMLAARDGHSKVLNLLVSHGAEVNAQDSNGYTVICYICHSQNTG